MRALARGPPMEIPMGATKRVRGVPTWRSGGMRALPWGLRWSSLWGYETCADGRGRDWRREEGEEEEEEETKTRAAVSSKRGSNTTGWLGTNSWHLAFGGRWRKARGISRPGHKQKQ